MGLHAAHAAHGAVRAGAHRELRMRKQHPHQPKSNIGAATVAPGDPSPQHSPIWAWKRDVATSQGCGTPSELVTIIFGQTTVCKPKHRASSEGCLQMPREQGLQSPTCPKTRRLVGCAAATAALSSTKTEQSRQRVNRFLMVCFISVL